MSDKMKQGLWLATTALFFAICIALAVKGPLSPYTLLGRIEAIEARGTCPCQMEATP